MAKANFLPSDPPAKARGTAECESRLYPVPSRHLEGPSRQPLLIQHLTPSEPLAIVPRRAIPIRTARAKNEVTDDEGIMGVD